MFEGNNKNTRTTVLSRSGVFIINFETLNIWHFFLVFLLLNLNRWMFAGYQDNGEFETIRKSC